MTVTIRRLRKPAEVAWAQRLLETEFGGRMQARRGEIMDALEGESLVAEFDGLPAGLITYMLSASGAAPEAEIRVLVTVDRMRGRGVGSALLDAVRGELRTAGVRRAWLVTTNDNLAALSFYQRRGWRLAELRPGAVDDARRTLKPEIAEVASNGIPIRDELELELTI